MRKSILLRVWMLALVVCLILIVSNARTSYASSGNAAPHTGGYEITWYTVDGGGAMNLAGGTYTLSGTAGQPDAGIQSQGSYSLSGGFWSIGLPDVLRQFLPFIKKYMSS